MAKAAIPIVLLGRMAEMGRIVTEHLRPEIGGMHLDVISKAFMTPGLY